ncbi:circadian-associated transcriptional repressor-like [Dicentrarchus labrax]|uniref:Circadian-associated transcriptional repressor n=1 Tax=Dicentrarchus labrax TaxID=13489 RepID=A0A8P4GKY5_DICLA|nr:circadian-associated transcriptional repressor-like [Dicentrarchus labrax]
MSTSDSDYSIDWLASDEDDYESPRRLSPQHTEEPPPPPSSSSTSSSLRESPTSCFHCGAAQRRRRARGDCKDGADPPAGLQAPSGSPVQGFTSVYTQHRSARKRAHSGLCEKPQAETENELFFHKCTELQCYIQPLSAILRGLRSGRYSERLSSFQESVAMDRIQRIMGVLQNPNMGGRFLSIILKIEEMLQSWFPNIKPTDDGSPPKKQKHPSSASSPPPPPASSLLCSSDVEPAVAASYSSTHLKWLHTSAICSLKTPESTLSRPAAAAAAASSPSASPLPARCSQEATQDNAVSSSTDRRTGRRLATEPRLPFKISSPCLERLLKAKDSIIAPRTVGDGGWLSDLV